MGRSDGFALLANSGFVGVLCRWPQKVAGESWEGRGPPAQSSPQIRPCLHSCVSFLALQRKQLNYGILSNIVFNDAMLFSPLHFQQHGMRTGHISEV